jgi:hypothetical protein
LSPSLTKSFVAVGALTLAGALVSGAAVTQDPDDLRTLRIDIGRLGVINEKTQQIWLKMRSDKPDQDMGAPVQLSSNLRNTVWAYNEMREELCNDKFVVEKSCGPPYVPQWVYETSKRVPSAKELQARQGELEQRVITLWDAACERLRKVIPSDDSQEYCSVE